MKFKSRRDNFFRILLFGAIFICFAPMTFVYQSNGLTDQFLISLLIIMAITGLLLWIWHHTHYKIDQEFIAFYSGPFKGKVEIDKIDKLVINKTSYVGLKYGLARKGLIVESSTHSDLYISPINPQEFVKLLLEQNPNIKIST